MWIIIGIVVLSQVAAAIAHKPYDRPHENKLAVDQPSHSDSDDRLSAGHNDHHAVGHGFIHSFIT